MKSILPVLVITLFLFALGTTVLAETPNATSTGVTKRETTLDNRQTKLETRKDTASREANLKLKLDKFKDQKKATIVQRVSDNLNRINQTRVDSANKFLANATRILDRLQERVTQRSSGKDASAANSAIANARSTIASASAAVTLQSSIDYTVTIASESGAKADTKTVRDKFHSDWLNVRKSLIEVKQAVADAVRVSATTLGGTK